MGTHVPDNLQCLFSTEVDIQEGALTIEVPEDEVTVGGIDPGTKYRVAILESEQQLGDNMTTASSGGNTRADGVSSDNDCSQTEKQSGPLQPPVKEDETLYVEIETTGDQGDGIAYTDNGFVIFVPDTHPGETVAIKITDVHDSHAFGSVIKRISN
jgi:predicted RNA-binding protein with TRAM domain